jgi:hypothetical protein
VPSKLASSNLYRKRLLYFLPLIGVAICLAALAVDRLSGPAAPTPEVKLVVQMSIPTPVPTFTPTPTPRPSPTITTTPLPPTPTATRVVAEEVYHQAATGYADRVTLQAEQLATAIAQLQTPGQFGSLALPARPKPAATPISFRRGDRLALAHYFAWYDGHSWDDCNISAGDKPLEPYDSDDPAAIARHIQLARQAGLNGFTLHWFAPGDRTDRNFSALLAASVGQPFASTVVFSRHFWPGSPAANRQNIAAALQYILDQYGDHPNFLRLEEKPVIFFIDVYRVPTAAGQTPPQFWAELRQQVDPQRQSWWMAEGLDASYLSVFDGLYVFKISHANSLHDYQKSPRWGDKVRVWAVQTGQPKLWLATISPGWDDLRSICQADVRVANTPHRLNRADGAVYEASFQAAMASQPDWLIVSSFNEWVEGSYIEPGVQYGDQYLQMTGEFVRSFQADR